MATQTEHLETIGHICATLQKPYGVIRRALAEVGAEPAIVLNGVPHFAEANVEAALAAWAAAALSGTLATGSPGALWQNIGGPASGDTLATGLYAAISEIEGGNVGPGAIGVTITVASTANVPAGGVSWWITSDSAGTATIAGTLPTNSLGQVLFMLNAGVNYLWRQSLTYNFPAPVPITVEGSSMSVTFADGTVIAGPVSGYATPSDMFQIFGFVNCQKWSILSANDPDSPAGIAESQSRYNWALSSSAVDFNNAMRQGGYTLPVTGPEATIWAKNVVATQAGLYLYQHLKPTQRGADGRPTPDRYDGIFTWAEPQLDFVRSRKLKLDAAVFGKGTNAPFRPTRGAVAPMGPVWVDTAPGHSRRPGRLQYERQRLVNMRDTSSSRLRRRTSSGKVGRP